jgi:hypothetical protein
MIRTAATFDPFEGTPEQPPQPAMFPSSLPPPPRAATNRPRSTSREHLRQLAEQHTGSRPFRPTRASPARLVTLRPTPRPPSELHEPTPPRRIRPRPPGRARCLLRLRGGDDAPPPAAPVAATADPAGAGCARRRTTAARSHGRSPGARRAALPTARIDAPFPVRTAERPAFHVRRPRRRKRRICRRRSRRRSFAIRANRMPRPRTRRTALDRGIVFGVVVSPGSSSPAPRLRLLHA